MRTRITETPFTLPKAWLFSAVMACCTLPAGATPEKSAKYYDDAAARLQKNDMAGAVIQLRNAITEDNKNLAAHLLFGKVLLGNGELKAAEAEFETARKLGISKSEVAVPLGQLYLQLGKTRELLETITVDGLPKDAQVEVLTLRGSAQALSGQLNEAGKLYAQARQLDPASPLPDIAEAPVILRMGERDKARAMALRATTLGPSVYSAWYQYGSVLLTLGDVKEALAAYDKAIALSPKHADSQVGRASCLLAMGRKEEALATLKFLKDEKVKEPRASFMRAVLAEERGDAAAAKAEYTDAANMIDALSPNVRNANEPMLLAGVLSHRGLGHNEKVREYLDAILGRNSRHLPALALLVETLVKAGDLTRATTAAEALLRAAPNDGQSLYLMGSVMLAKRQYGPAAEFLERAAKASPDSGALRDLSLSQFGLGQDKAALSNLEKAYARNPRDTFAGMQLAVTYARQGKGPQAVKLAEEIAGREPDNLALITFVGNIKGRLGDKAGLRASYEKALAKDAKFRPVVMNMSWLDMEEGKLDAARIRLKGFLKVQPKDPDVLFQLGLLEQMARRPGEAATAWTEADRIQNRDPRPLLSLVDLKLAAQQNAEALTLARSAAARYADVPQVQVSLARAYLANGDTPLARKTLQEASSKAGFAAPAVLQSIARLYLQMGNADDAQFVVNKLLQSAPDDPATMALAVETAGRKGDAAGIDAAMAKLRAKHPQHLLTLTTAGHIAFARGQLASAISQYQAAYAKEPSTQLALTISQAYLANKEPAKAASLMKSWLDKNPADLVALRALAEFQGLAGQPAESRASFEKLVKELPADAQVLGAYARMLARAKDPAALAAAEKAFKMSPNASGLADLYGTQLAERGQVEAGIKVLRDARLRDPQNGQLRLHLAEALARSGKQAEARDELRGALSAANPPQAGEGLQKLRQELGV